MESLLAMSSAAAAAAAGLLGAAACLCTRSREYQSITNKVETDAVLEMVCKHGLYSHEIKPKTEWRPIGCSVGWCFCAYTQVHTSEYDPHQQTYDVTLYRPPCLPWSWLPLGKPDATGSANSAWEANSKAAPELPTHLDHMVIDCSRKDWPGPWGFDKRMVHPPGTFREQLVHADHLARHSIGLLNENGSGAFLVRGPGAVGKSSAGWTLAQMLGEDTILCKEFDPTEAGLLFSEVLKARDQLDGERYLVLELDEWDKWMHKIAVTEEGKTEPVGIADHPKLRTEVINKAGWHRFVHKVLTSKRVILWMPANIDDTRLESYDQTMLRGNNRITAHYKWDVDAGCFVVVQENGRVPEDVYLRPPQGANASGRIAKPPAPPGPVQVMARDDSACSLTEPLLGAATLGAE
jgi:hypothetical protein